MIFRDILRESIIDHEILWYSRMFHDALLYLAILKSLYVMISMFPKYCTIFKLLNTSLSKGPLPHTHQPPVENRTHALPRNNWSVYSLRLVLGHQDGQKELRGPSVRMLWISNYGKYSEPCRIHWIWNIAAYIFYCITRYSTRVSPGPPLASGRPPCRIIANCD